MKYKDELNQIISLAKSRPIEQQCFSPKEFLESGFLNKDDEPLEEYLMSLDIDILRHAITVMYVGRDCHPKPSENEKDRDLEFNEYEYQYEDIEYDDPKESYENLWKHLSSMNSFWTDKFLLTNQMSEKMPLDKYLTRGLELLF